MHSRAHQGVDTGSSVEEEKTEEEDERLSPSDTESVVAAPSLYCSVLTCALGEHGELVGVGGPAQAGPGDAQVANGSAM